MMIKKPSKTLAGVTPVAVILKPYKCKHGTCVYCPSLGVPQSYTPKSPAIMRARMLEYDPYKQVKARILAYKSMGHPTSKIELIIMGGTFLDYPIKYQEFFIKRCYDALNNKEAKNLSEAKKINETANNRCVALCIETRPDVCSKKEIMRMLKFGCTRVELGVQIIDDRIYKLIKRGHKVKDVIEATKRLKDAGFKVGYHIMPGLPGSNPKKDLRLFKKLFNDSNFKPDQLKIYPCQVIPGSELEKWYYKGKYKPYSEEELIKLIIEMLKEVPEYCRVMRIMRELPPEFIVSGTIKTDLRKIINERIIKEKIKIKEIRSREIGFIQRDFGKQDKDIKLDIKNYLASGGEEYFLSLVNQNDVLFGLLRLRFCKSWLPQLRDCAIVRELHIYGKSVEIGDRGYIQHTGLGKTLMEKAEEIAKLKGYKRIAVISGVGAREYYRKIGYKFKNKYMIKTL